MTKRLKDLKANPENPRKISDDKLEKLKAALKQFGDLSGFVFNRTTGQLVGGHQRAKVLPPEAQVRITHTYPEATKAGTVATGYVRINGERFSYREVDWDETMEKAANIAANRGGGEWDEKLLSNWFRDLDEFGFDLDLTMFDADERADLLVPSLSPNFEEGSEADQGKLDEKKKTVCPHCGEEFLVGGRK